MTDIDLSDLAADRDGSRPLRGYLASPAGTGPWSAVVMIHAEPESAKDAWNRIELFFATHLN